MGVNNLGCSSLLNMEKIESSFTIAPSSLIISLKHNSTLNTENNDYSWLQFFHASEELG